MPIAYCSSLLFGVSKPIAMKSRRPRSCLLRFEACPLSHTVGLGHCDSNQTPSFFGWEGEGGASAGSEDAGSADRKRAFSNSSRRVRTFHLIRHCLSTTCSDLCMCTQFVRQSMCGNLRRRRTPATCWKSRHLQQPAVIQGCYGSFLASGTAQQVSQAIACPLILETLNCEHLHSRNRVALGRLAGFVGRMYAVC